jgi:parvulin-like peptidyl-prolyl isomerase
MPPFVFTTQRQREKYDKLAYNVKKVWPYAKIIKRVYAQLVDSLSKIDNEEDKKAYIKSQEKILRAQFEDQLVKLSISQGRILIKLVDRETGSTTYEVLKELKGSFSAFIFQGIARLFGSNLKSEYDALEEDKMIEDILVRIENGQL